MKRRSEKISEEYLLGIKAHKDGRPDVNPFGVSDLLKMCLWSAGYWDSKREMV